MSNQAQRRVMFKKHEPKEEKPCEVCKGSGRDPQNEEQSCPKCDGTGKQ